MTSSSTFAMRFLFTGVILSVSQMVAREVVDRMVQLQDERDDRHRLTKTFVNSGDLIHIFLMEHVKYLCHKQT